MNEQDLQLALAAALATPGGPLESIAVDLAIIRRLTKPGGRPVSVSDNGALSGGATTLTFRGPAVGRLWFVELAAITTDGASAAATAQLFMGQAVDDNMLGFVSAFQGNTPSRATIKAGQELPNEGAVVWGGVPVLVAVQGSAGSYAACRLQARELEMSDVNLAAGSAAAIG